MIRYHKIRGKLYEALSVDTGFEEKPILEMDPYGEGPFFESLDSYKSAPFCIKLLCRLNPIPLDIQLSTLEAKVIKQMSSLEAVMLYPTSTRTSGYENSFDISSSAEGSISNPILWDGVGEVIQGIELFWEGKSLVQWKEGDLPYLFSGGNIEAYHIGSARNLFIKAFLCWDSSLTIQEISHIKEETGEEEIQILPASSPMCIPIFPYGGYYRLGLPLDQIEPLFLQVLEHDNRACLSVTRKENWKEKGIIPPHAGKRGMFTIEFFGKYGPISLLTLAETILGGHIKMTLKDQEEEISIGYTSFFYETVEGEKDLYWISFCHAELDSAFYQI